MNPAPTTESRPAATPSAFVVPAPQEAQEALEQLARHEGLGSGERPQNRSEGLDA